MDLEHEKWLLRAGLVETFIVTYIDPHIKNYSFAITSLHDVNSGKLSYMKWKKGKVLYNTPKMFSIMGQICV